MSYMGSGDDQSEDGELRHSPTQTKSKLELDFSLSEEDVDTADSLDIKPPQMNRLTRDESGAGGGGRSKRRERNRDGRNRHGRPEHEHEHRRERIHSHRDKRHRSGRDHDRDTMYRSDKEHNFREQRDLYRDRNTGIYITDPSTSSSSYKDSRYNECKYVQHEPSTRYAGKRKETGTDLRYVSESEPKRRHESVLERKSKSMADQTLDDLRERLLDKRKNKDGDRYDRRKAKEVLNSPEDADAYVQEIIDLSTDDKIKQHKRDDKEEDWSSEDEALTELTKMNDAEREEQELRKEKLLETEREIARQKEEYKLNRERRQERLEIKRQLQQLQQQQQDGGDDDDDDNDDDDDIEEEYRQKKRQRMSGELDQYKNKDLSIVTVSDNSSIEDGGTSSEREEDKDDGNENESENVKKITSGSESDRLTGESSSDNDDGSERNEASDNDRRRDSSRSRSPSRSASRSPKNQNGQLNDPIKSSKEPLVVIKKLDDDLPPYFPAIQGCRSVEEFQCLNRIEEGTYGVVYRARDKRTEEIVALKRLKMEKEKEGFPITSLREINTLLKAQHPNIVTVREIVVGSNMDKIFIVMDYVEHDLKSLMETMRSRRQVFVPGEVKCLLQQLLSAVAHLHDNWILHRDLKTSNLLLSHRGMLKVGDFGLAREYGSPLKAYTPIVVTLWYRAPELLLCCKEYSTPIDMWSVGCIFAEFVLMNAIFPGKSEVDQLNRIFKDLGTPNEKIWPGYNELPAVKKMKFAEHPASQIRSRFGMLTDLGQNLLQRFLTYDPKQRISAEDALKHAYFAQVPLPIDPAMFPTWPAKSELGHRKVLASPKPPSGGREYKQLGDGDEDSALGFHMGVGNSALAVDARRLPPPPPLGGGFSLKF